MAITKIQSESLNLADDFAFTGTITGAGESNKPAFKAKCAADQTGLSNSTYVKLNFTTELFDTNSAYDAANSKFTVPTGEGGKYCFHLNTTLNYDGSQTNVMFLTMPYVNGSQASYPRHQLEMVSGHYLRYFVPASSFYMELSAGDYVEMYGYGEGSNWQHRVNGQWGGYKVST